MSATHTTAVESKPPARTGQAARRALYTAAPNRCRWGSAVKRSIRIENPHTALVLEVKGDNGSKVVEFEGHSTEF